MNTKTTPAKLFLLWIIFILPLQGQDFLSEIQKEKNNYFMLVPFYFYQGQPEKAEVLINEFLEKYPRDPIMLTEKAVLLNQFKNKPDEALAVIAKARESYPTYYYLNFLHASILYNKAIANQTPNVDLLQQAAKYLEMSIQDNEQLFESLYLAGIVQAELNEPETSNRYFEQAVKLRDTLPVYIYMSYNYRRIGDVDKELDTYHNILRLDPKNERVKKPLAEVYMKKKEFFQSYLTLLDVKEENRDAGYHALMLELYSVFNMNQRVIQMFQVLSKDDEVLKKLPLSIIYRVIYAFGNLGRFQEARYALIVAEGLYPRQKELISDMAQLTKRFLDREEITLEHARFNYNLLVALHFYKSQKRYREATALIERLSAQKKDLPISLELCDILSKQGKNKKAEALILKLQTDYGDSPDWQNYYAYFLALRNKSLDSALEFSRAALDSDSESPAFLDTYGYILLKMKRYEQAEEYLEQAYSKNPLDREIISHMVECYDKLGKHKEIRDIYQLAIDHDVDFKLELQKELEHVR